MKAWWRFFPALAWFGCLDEVPQPRQIRYDLRSSVPIVDPDPCRAQRSFAMLAAHQIKDLKERTRVLLALPVCSTTPIPR